MLASAEYASARPDHGGVGRRPTPPPRVMRRTPGSGPLAREAGANGASARSAERRLVPAAQRRVPPTDPVDQRHPHDAGADLLSDAGRGPPTPSPPAPAGSGPAW